MKVLILGAAGYLGKVLFSHCKAKTEMSVYGTCFTNPIEGIYSLDVLDEANTRKVIELCNPDVVVWCLKSNDKEQEIDNLGLKNVLSAIKPEVRFIYISSTLSTKENQDEETLSEPKDEGMYMADYFNGKITGERLTQSHSNHVIIRPGQIFGFGADGEHDIRMCRIKEEIIKNSKVVRTDNIYISIIHVEDLADCIIELFYSDYKGILCIAADKAVSYFEFYRILAKLIGVSQEKIISNHAEKPSGNYFNTTKAKSLLKTQIRNFVADSL